MAKKTINTPLINKGMDEGKDLNEEEITSLLNSEGNIPGAKTFDEPDIINEDAIWDDTHLVKEELLENIVIYSENLVSVLEGIYIGGHAAQVKDQLYTVLHQYRNYVG